MRFLRRRSGDEGAAESVGASSTNTGAAGAVPRPSGRSHTAGKGRPTPKRRDAETKRRGPAPPPPKTQREAIKLARTNRAAREQRRRESGTDRRSRLLAGDQKVLPPRDRGPVRAYVRDLVDSRRHLIGFFMPLAVLVFASLFLRAPRVQNVVTLFVMAMMAVMAIEGVFLGLRVSRAVRRKFPKEKISVPGLSWYAFARASQLRRLRVPKPRVGIGDTLDDTS